MQEVSPSTAWLPILLVFLAIVALYAFTAPPTVAFEDDGEFIMAAYYLGVAHPPGYPLWVLLAHPFTWLPFGSVAWRVHLASGVFGAAACATLWWSGRTLVPGRAAAWVAALGLGVSLSFWSQAVIADVYSLNVLLFLASLAACLSYLRAPRPAPLRALALLAGFALSNHWPLTLLAAPGLILILWPARSSLWRHLRREAAWMGLLFGAGLLPYVWMVLRSRTAPELAFYASIDGWSGIRDYLLRSVYEGSATAGAGDRLRFGAFYGGEILRQYTPVGALLAGVGAVAGWRRWGAALATGLILAFLGATLGLLLMLRVDYEFLNRAVLRVFPLVPYSVIALWLAMGFRVVSERLPAQVRRPAVVGALGAALILLVAVANVSRDDRHDYDFADHWGRTVLSTFEPGATVFTRRDHETFVLGYLHQVEGERPDLALLMDWGVGMARDGRLFHPLKVAPAEKERRVVRFVRDSQVPVYIFVRPPEPLGYVDLGMYWRVDPGVAERRAVMSLDPTLRQLFREMAVGPPSPDPWTEYVRGEQIAGMSRVLTGIVHLTPDPENLPGSLRADLELASRHYLGLVERIGLLTNQGGAPPEELLAWTRRAEAMLDDTVSKVNRAHLFLIRGRILAKMGRPGEALAAFDRSIAVYPDPSNPSFEERRRLLGAGAGADGGGDGAR